ncbi:hypothetical protein V8D89_010306 [Ganoderma adspersum]
MTTTNEASRTLDRSPALAETDPTASDNTYPPQRHTGAVGYGPEYGKGTGTADKLQGLKEEFKGKVLHKPELVQHGRELRSGELKRKEKEADSEMDPFNTTGKATVGDQDKQDEGQRLRSATTAPEGTEEENEQTRKLS